MHRRNRILVSVAVIAGFVAPVGALALSSGPATAAPSSPAPMPYTCSGGDLQTGTFVSIPSGTYASITVKGACQPAPNAVINVVGNVEVTANSAFDAQSFPSTITVGHNVTAGAGSLLGLGCLPNPPGHMTGHPCVEVNGNGSPTTKTSNVTVNGNIITWDANTVLLNGITVGGSVSLIGGGGAIPWAIKTNTIGGNVLIAGASPEWIGLIVNKVGGSVVLLDDHITDTDPTQTIQIGNNTIGQNLICFDLGPAVGGGFGPPNTVGHLSLGQCANLNPATP